MTADYFLRHLCGFLLQLMPATVLLLLPFDRVFYRLPPRRVWGILTAAAAALALVFAFSVQAVHLLRPGTGEELLFGNLFLGASILVILVLFFLLIRDRRLHKAFVFFSVVAFSVIQYSFVNLILGVFKMMPAGQAGQSYDLSTCIAYLVVTAMLLPPVVGVFRSQLRTYIAGIRTADNRSEFVLLMVMTALYLVLNMLFSWVWIQLQQTHIVANTALFSPVLLLLTAMLFVVYYSIIRMANMRAKEAEREREAAVIRMDHDRIRKNMSDQRRRLHDMRQLMRTMYTYAMNGETDKLRDYYGEIMENVQLVEETYCLDSCMNGILQYYAALAASSGVPLRIHARCANLSSVSESSLTVLMGNALENAIRAALEFRELHPERQDEITLTAEESQNTLSVQIENPCDQVSYTNGKGPEGEGFQPAGAFASTSGGGNGLLRIASIAERYSGMASFRFDAEQKRFITRFTLAIPERGVSGGGRGGLRSSPSR